MAFVACKRVAGRRSYSICAGTSKTNHAPVQFFDSRHVHPRVALSPFWAILLKSPKTCFEPAAPSTVGGHLKKRRIELGLRQIDVAHQLEVNEHSIVKWEAGRTPLDRCFPRIIEFLGYDPRPEPRTLAERLVWKRQTVGLPRKTAARLLGVDEGSLARWEWGVRKPTGSRRDKVLWFLTGAALG